MNKNNGQCLTEQAMTGGVPAVAQCNEAPSQQWTLRYTADSYSYVLINHESGLCLTANGATNPVTIELDSCNKQPSQLWYMDGTL